MCSHANQHNQQLEQLCKVIDSIFYLQEGQAAGDASGDESSGDKENAQPKERKGGPRRKVKRMERPNRSNQAAAASEVGL